MSSRAIALLVGSILGGLILVGSTCCGLFYLLIVPREYESYTASSDAIEIRVRAPKEGELGLAVPGGVFHYESRTPSDQKWTPITSFRFSRPDPIPRDQIHFVDGDLIYFHHEFVLGVSTDGGESWVIHGEPDLSFDTLRPWRYPRITSVTIQADGTGVMEIEPYYSTTTFDFETVTTKDFGRTWQDESGKTRLPLPN